jgi:hypothetical protein
MESGAGTGAGCGKSLQLVNSALPKSILRNTFRILKSHYEEAALHGISCT